MNSLIIELRKDVNEQLKGQKNIFIKKCVNFTVDMAEHYEYIFKDEDELAVFLDLNKYMIEDFCNKILDDAIEIDDAINYAYTDILDRYYSDLEKITMIDCQDVFKDIVKLRIVDILQSLMNEIEKGNDDT
tara:strand:- start:611 stop:1003 length:393 start_codon:yes stop_codon:yes gene_type:complete